MSFYLDKKFAQILKDCNEIGWDGYGAKVITPETIAVAKVFASLVDAYMPILNEDEPMPCNDNVIGFEWEVEPNHKNWLIVCVGEESCYYASSFRGLPGYKGKFQMPDVPPIIFTLLERIKLEKEAQ